MRKIQSSAGSADRGQLRAMTMEELEASIADRRDLDGPDDYPADWFAPENWFRGDKYPKPREIRDALKLSQAQFAKRFGLSVKTIQHWEQSRTVPDRAALILLKTIELYPAEVKRAVDAMRVKPLPDP